jgi:phosphate-selective porin OprO/OprP
MFASVRNLVGREQKEDLLMTAKVVRGALAAAGAVLLSLAAAGGAWAQGFYYKEIKKDDRFYVFNDAAKAEAFEKTGEMGVGITRLGAGPNGETVVADSEQALDLFFFKHGIAVAVERPKPPVQRIEWRDGKTRITTDKAYLEISNRIQVRFTDELPDDSVQLAGTGAKGDSKGSFRLRRAKFKLEGWFYRPELEYELQLNWPDVNNTPPGQMLEDADIDWDLTKKKLFRVRFGQFKGAYGRQQITSSGAQQFVDRAQTDGRYNPGRETGLALWGTLGVYKLDWRFMASNGNGRTQAANDNDKYLYTARVQWQALGNTRMNQWTSGLLLTEGDLGDSVAAGGKPLLAIAANVLSNNRFNVTTGNDLNNTQFSGDYTFKYRGFASVAEYHHRKSKPETGTEFKDKGYLVQASYAWKAPGPAGGAFWEIAGRYSQIDPSDLRSGDKVTETGGAVNYYYNKHNLKVQADFRQIKDAAANSGLGTRSKEFRLQTQFIF